MFTRWSKILMLLMIPCVSFLAQLEDAEVHIRKARKYLGQNDFSGAENEYLNAVKASPKNFDACFELGLLYNNALFNQSKAFSFFKEAEIAMNKDTIYELFYYLGKSYQYHEKYDQAIQYFRFFQEGIIKKQKNASLQDRIERLVNECYFAKRYATNNGRFNGRVKNLGENINTPYAEYAPVFSKRDSLLFFARRGDDNVGNYYWDSRLPEDIYWSSLKNNSFENSAPFDLSSSSVKNLSNTEKHEAFVAINSQEDALMLYKKNKLWYSTLNGEEWNEPVEYPKGINMGSYQRHGSLSTDGKTLYFTSNSKKGIGGLDLFFSTKDASGSWGEPINMGDIVNTMHDEDSPFISEDGNHLYFASNGHNGFGGYDLFVTERVGETWTEPTNLGSPINSPGDDVHLRILDENGSLHLASSRKGGYGDMDIFKFTPYGVPLFGEACDDFANHPYQVNVDITDRIEKTDIPLVFKWDMGDGSIRYGKKFDHTYKRPGVYQIKFTVVDSITQKEILSEDILSGTIPLTYDLSGYTHIEALGPDTVEMGEEVSFDATLSKVVGSFVTHYFWLVDDEVVESDKLVRTFHSEGIHRVALEVIGRNEDGEEYHYCTRKEVVSLSRKELDSLLALKAEDELAEYVNQLSLENIYFDFNKYSIDSESETIIKQHAKILTEYADVTIKVVGHTDAIGPNDYNNRLSRKRAVAVVNYLEKQGISRQRIKATLHEGEEHPAAPNFNPDGSDNPDGRQKNRRVEFYILGMNTID